MMRLFERLREILTFRWLEGLQEQEECDAKSVGRRAHEGAGRARRYSSGRTYGGGYPESTRRRRGQSLAEFHEEQDDYDMMDDF